MPISSFLFTVQIAQRSDAMLAMLDAIAESAMERLGLAPVAIESVRRDLRAALEQGRAETECTVEFRGEGGELIISVAFGGGPQIKIMSRAR